ncbi:uncharacterized protein LOC110620801 isoform X3 [Manihot esculenta]|uniref:uncharacterized protein LOC110620801 isoform X3 n=1 Tax=Manihot esculenta TaxID=3983 RepID=UPI000B5D8998|nr:uncharacterized protein LOC110620801 isoform X3 [Manihot esculenta]
MQQTPQPQMLNPSLNITTEQIQKYLDENKQLIMAILENQNMGKFAECASSFPSLKVASDFHIVDCANTCSTYRCGDCFQYSHMLKILLSSSATAEPDVPS